MNERLNALYKEIETILNNSPSVEDCTNEENKIYFDMASLKDSLFDAGYGR